METRHGPHQVAQNSTMYALPFWKSFTGWPCTHFAGSSLGAGSPTLRVGSAARASVAPAAQASSVVVLCNCLFILISSRVWFLRVSLSARKQPHAGSPPASTGPYLD